MGVLRIAFRRRARPSHRLLAFLLPAFLALEPRAQPAGDANAKGLDFPSNGQPSIDIRFRFTGANLQPMYPATYIWRVKVRHQSGYYTTFFWGPDGPFTGDSYYGCHPYPDGGGPETKTHKWELSIYGNDYVADANGHSTQLGYDVWRTQAFRAIDDGAQKVHEFYWDLPDTGKVIRVKLDRSYGAKAPANPALTFGDAPWSVGWERLSGVLRGIQLYSAYLSVSDIGKEIESPMSSPAGAGGIWYLNLDPTPQDISDKSGKGHHPAWVGPARPSAWSAAATTLSRPPARAGREGAAPRSILLRRDARMAGAPAMLDGLGRAARGDAAGMRLLTLP